MAEGEEQFKLHGSGKTMDGQIVFARYVVMEPFGKGEWDRKVERKAPLIMKARLEAIIDGERVSQPRPQSLEIKFQSQCCGGKPVSQ